MMVLDAKKTHIQNKACRIRQVALDKLYIYIYTLLCYIMTYYHTLYYDVCIYIYIYIHTYIILYIILHYTITDHARATQGDQREPLRGHVAGRGTLEKRIYTANFHTKNYQTKNL